MSILDPGYNLTLRPMKYPEFYEMYKDALKNTWTVNEVDFSIDVRDIATKLSDAERHMLNRLVAFFATGDTIVANNLVINLYRRLNSPEARMYLSRQLFEEALHIQFYLTLLDTYVPDIHEREAAFQAVYTIPSIAMKAAFCQKWIDAGGDSDRDFVKTLVCFAACIEGLFFFSAFAYIYFLRSKGLLPGLASGTNWVFRDESMHMSFAFAVLAEIKRERPELWDAHMQIEVEEMFQEAVEIEKQFARDLLQFNIIGLSESDMCKFIDYTMNCRRQNIGLPVKTYVNNPFTFMALQDMQELTNFFERRVAAYQTGVAGKVSFDEEF